MNKEKLIASGYFVIEPDNKGIRYIDKNNNWQLAKNWNEYKNYWRSIIKCAIEK